MRNLIWVAVTVLPLLLNAQKHDQTWAFGTFENVSLQFLDSAYIADSLHGDIRYFFTSASICDTAGNLQFYTNGRVVMNSNGDTMTKEQDLVRSCLNL